MATDSLCVVHQAQQNALAHIRGCAQAGVMALGVVERTGGCAVRAVPLQQALKNGVIAHGLDDMTYCQRLARTFLRGTGNNMYCYAGPMSKISLERAVIAVLDHARPKNESATVFARRVMTWIPSEQSRNTMWHRLVRPDKTTGKYRSLSLDEADSLSRAVGLRIEDGIARARAYQVNGILADPGDE